MSVNVKVDVSWLKALHFNLADLKGLFNFECHSQNE